MSATRVLKIQLNENTRPIYFRHVDNIISFTPALSEATRMQPKVAWRWRQMFGGSIHLLRPKQPMACTSCCGCECARAVLAASPCCTEHSRQIQSRET